MESKTILFTVDGDSISPKTEQKAGVQGQHNITDVRFEGDILSEAKSNPNEFKVRIQFIDGAGGFYSTGFLTVYSDETDGRLFVTCPIPNNVTNAGGLAYVYLVVTKITYEGEKALEDQEYISPPGKLFYTHSGVGSPSEYAYRVGITNALVNAEIFAGQAERYSNEAKNAESNSAKSESAAATSAANASTSENNAKGFESAAASSATTASEASVWAKKYRDETATMFENFNGIQLWQPNTEYKVGDIVISDVADAKGVYTAILTCKKDHISDDSLPGSTQQEECWNIKTALDNITVDQTYNPESENPQSGIAVAEAVNAPETDPKFFDIDVDGLISLKPEYRGAASSDYANAYPFCISDNGIDKEGSKIGVLPERIVIPNNIDGEQVKGFKEGMFSLNKKIKEVVLPPTTKDIPKGMFREAIYLEKVENTEQIETIGEYGFSRIRAKELYFPNLISMSNNRPFSQCTCLETIDIGKVTSIGGNAFLGCDNLVYVLGGSNVTSIGERAFIETRRLKKLPFLSNVTSIGKQAFYGSNCDFEEVYNDLVENNCTFGANATYKQFNDTDYWSGATFTPCKNPLKSTFHQKNSLWADKVIDETNENYVDEQGKPFTYGEHSCAFFLLASIYSAFEEVEIEKPEDFYKILKDKGLSHLDFRYREYWCQIANGLGYQTEFISTMTTEKLEKIYNSLADGGLVYKSFATSSTVDGGHTLLGYGVNSVGEMLLSDTNSASYRIGIYDNHKITMPIYKHGSKECDAVIVKKVNA